MEEWKTIPSFPDYEASTLGRIRNKNAHKIIKDNVNGGYCQIILYKEQKRYPRKVHRLIAETYIDNPENKETVNHKDKNRQNNQVSNLEWLSVQENNEHKVRENFQRRDSTFRPVWKCDKVTKMKIKKYDSACDAAKELNTTMLKSAEGKIRYVANGHRMSTYGFFWQWEDYPTIIGEEWKLIPPEHINGTEGYEVSSAGRVRKTSTGKIFLGCTDESGYTRVSINEKLYRMHIVVAKTFIPNPENKPHVNHKDGKRNNNDVINLEWCTRSENMQHAYDTGLNKKGVGSKKRD